MCILQFKIFLIEKKKKAEEFLPSGQDLGYELLSADPSRNLASPFHSEIGCEMSGRLTESDKKTAVRSDEIPASTTGHGEPESRVLCVRAQTLLGFLS